MKSATFVLALVIAIATYFVAVNTMEAGHILAVAIGFAMFLVINGGAMMLGRSPRR